MIAQNKTQLSTIDTSNLEKLYSTSKEHVRRSGLNPETALPSYKHYVEYMNAFTDLKKKTVLDVGCGNGWSSYFLAQYADRVMAMDVHSTGFEPQPTEKLQYKQSSVTKIDFPDRAFDIVSTHECLEHISEPIQALNELDRVLKPGGYIFILGPNLFSLLQSLRGLLFYVWKTQPRRGIFIRTANTPRHPHGNTIFEIIFCFLKNLFYITKLYLFKKPLFLLREPDTRPPFHADNDACYYLNPLDLKYYFESKNYEIINYCGLNRSNATVLIPSGTWFVAKKNQYK